MQMDCKQYIQNTTIAFEERVTMTSGIPCPECWLWGHGGGGLLSSGRQLPPSLTVGRRPPGGGGGGAWEGSSGRGDGGGSGTGCGGGGGSGGTIWGEHAPKAKHGSITGSPYLPLPTLQPHHHPKPNPNLCSELVQPCQPC